MQGVNKIILVGNVGHDPETKYTRSGSMVARLSIATSENWDDRQTGQQQKRTEWHRVVFFNRLAEVVGEYVRKGSKLYIEGKLQTSKWQDQSGVDRYITQIHANQMQMLDSRGRQDAGPYGPPPAQSQQQQQQAPSDPGPSAPQAMDSFDDDIPF